MMDPISGSVISDAAKRVSSSGIGRTTTEIVVKGNKTYIYEDNFEFKLWELGAVAGIGALIYYTPAIIQAYSPGQIVKSIGEWWEEAELFKENGVPPTGPIIPIIKKETAPIIDPIQDVRAEIKRRAFFEPP